MKVSLLDLLTAAKLNSINLDKSFLLTKFFKYFTIYIKNKIKSISTCLHKEKKKLELVLMFNFILRAFSFILMFVVSCTAVSLSLEVQ